MKMNVNLLRAMCIIGLFWPLSEAKKFYTDLGLYQLC